ncbi:hypothetical protein AOXY_G7582 [Acipenser oxyrinchus oxyrinchus]|uniref:Endonuclease/exonuclease/phosphatase domain-containing protein n=1 Tax=Acipenser oxyrinchus oxyrinchus TaxID=40147 RepID=A0AAD8LN97_ACIOX|nr:hypothetical protein AOXY_G7582 [Acipenser oxyrinchus oxyrinchus]
MFTRNLNLLGRSWFTQTEVSHNCWRSPYLCSPAWWTGLPPWMQQSYHSGSHSMNFRPPGRICGSVWSRSPRQRFCQAAPFHTSSGLMELWDSEPEFKRRCQDERQDPREALRHRGWNSSSYRADSRTRNLHSFSQNGPAESVTSGNSQTPEQTRKRGETVGYKYAEQIQRHWEYFSPYKEKSRPHAEVYIADGEKTEEFDFTVMSYNILSQHLLEDNAHLYKHCRRPILHWGHRFPNIEQELKQHNADILCLQEVQEDHYKTQIKPSLESLGYHCEYKMRTGRKPDGCAIGFKQSKFSLVSSHPVEFFRHGIPLLDRDNVGLILLLKPTATQSPAPSICVANTHLLYNPRRGDIKLTQLAMLLAEIGRVSVQEDGSCCPIILCGDFNSVPGSPLYSFVKEGKLDYEGLLISKISGQEQTPRGQRILSVPLWPKSLGISHSCQYETGYHSNTDKSTDDTEDSSNVPSAVSQDKSSPPSEKVRSSIEHQFNLTSVYSHYLSEGRRPEITTCHSKTATTVDYIFYSAAKDDLTVQAAGGSTIHNGQLQVLARLSLLSENELWPVNGLPNEHNSSDHLPLLAKFRLLH